MTRRNRKLLQAAAASGLVLLVSSTAGAIPQPPHDEAGNDITCTDCHAPYASMGDPGESEGAATAGSGVTTLMDSAKTWDADEWKGGVLSVLSGANAGEFREVISNGASNASWELPLPQSLSAGDQYKLGKTTYQNIETKCKSCHNPTGQASSMPDVGLHSIGGGEVVGCGKCHDPHNIEPNSGQGNGLLRDTPRWPSANGAVAWPSGGANVYVKGSAPYNGVCEICHTQTSYHRNNAGGDHSHNSSQGCKNCHGHDGGFAAQNCTDCHNQPQGGRRQIVGAAGDFVRAAHHVQGPVADADCKVCHSMSGHQLGTVLLKDPDLGEALVHSFEPSNPAGSEGFCLNCHDSDGAAAGGGMTPFSDGLPPPDVKRGGLWAASMHGNFDCSTCHGGAPGPRASCLGDGAMTGCHGNGHGSNLKKILSPFDGSAGTDNENEEEGFCFNCHRPGSVTNEAVSNGWLGGSYRNYSDGVEHAFGLLSSHPVRDSQAGHVFDRGAGNEEIECASCHNPHQDTGKFWRATAGKTPVLHPATRAVWGDDASEKAGTWDPGHSYQAPSLGAAGNDLSGTPLPIDGSGNSQLTGTVLPDYNTMCLSCHQYAIGGFVAIDWTGKKHGSASAEPNTPPQGYPLDLPYASASRGQYYLDCMDCHEAHGSSNVRLLRMGANGAVVASTITVDSTYEWRELCNLCHGGTGSERHHNNDVYQKLGYGGFPGCTVCHDSHTMYTSCVTSTCHGHDGHF